VRARNPRKIHFQVEVQNLETSTPRFFDGEIQVSIGVCDVHAFMLAPFLLQLSIYTSFLDGPANNSFIILLSPTATNQHDFISNYYNEKKNDNNNLGVNELGMDVVNKPCCK
jgi:hypothetical protein